MIVCGHDKTFSLISYHKNNSGKIDRVCEFSGRLERWRGLLEWSTGFKCSHVVIV